MAVIRINKTRDYTIMSNAHFKEKEMSLKAKGLLSLMLSLPDDWDYSIEGLVALSNDGSTSVRGALKELENFKYLVRTPVRNKGKIVDWQYDIFEQPQEEKPLVEKPLVENPQVENHIQLNTKELNTKELRTEDIKYIVEYLNSKCGTSYKSTTQSTQKHIKARLNEGFTIDDFKTVIDKKAAEWQGTDMAKYLRPETLFGTKFESYLNQSESPKAKQRAKEPDLDLDRRLGTVL